MKKSLTLVIAVYNAVKYLQFIFAALERQSKRDFEVIVADDGSGPDIGRLIDETRSKASFPIQHLWHEDQGFRKNAMLNRAINASTTDYLLFIDGDCVPHHHFISDHWSHRKPTGVLCGRRVNMSQRMTDRLTIEDVRSGKIERHWATLLIDGMLRQSSNLEDGIRISNNALRGLIPRNRARILGCNFSVEKKLLEEINGFNEEYQSPGIGEDSDVAFRLERAGAELVSLRYLAVLYHLAHPAAIVGDENRRIYDRVVATNEIVCRRGLRHIDRSVESSIFSK